VRFLGDARARWVTPRARWVTPRTCWVTPRACWVTRRARWAIRVCWSTRRRLATDGAGRCEHLRTGGCQQRARTCGTSTTLTVQPATTSAVMLARVIFAAPASRGIFACVAPHAAAAHDPPPPPRCPPLSPAKKHPRGGWKTTGSTQADSSSLGWNQTSEKQVNAGRCNTKGPLVGAVRTFQAAAAAVVVVVVAAGMSHAPQCVGHACAQWQRAGGGRRARQLVVRQRAEAREVRLQLLLRADQRPLREGAAPRSAASESRGAWELREL
jgi:hypothetical protein